MFFEDALLLALPVAFFFGGTFVLLALALGESDFELRPAAGPVQAQWNHGKSAPLHGAHQAVDLLAVQEQLAATNRIGGDVTGGAEQRSDVGAYEPCLAVLEHYVGFAQLGAALAHAFDFPALQRQARLEAVFDEVVMARLFVLGDGVGVCAFASFFLSHGISSRRELFHNPGGAGSGLCYDPANTVLQMFQTVSRSAQVPYTASEMYALVADVEKYPAFLPWCRNARIREPGEDAVEASLEIGRGPIRKTFTTRNVMTRNARIDIGLIDGPFKHLKGCWQFTALDGAGSRIGLQLEFELSNALLRRTLGPLFNEITNTMVDAFCRRAEELYG